MLWVGVGVGVQNEGQAAVADGASSHARRS
jgi:hypothetical protein